MIKSIFAAALVAGVVGFGAGIAAYRSYMQPAQELLETLPLSREAAESVECVSTLRLLRAGNTDSAIRILEIRLDGALIGLGTLYPNASTKARDETHAPAALRLAQEYRRANPYSSDARYSGAVVAALAISTN